MPALIGAVNGAPCRPYLIITLSGSCSGMYFIRTRLLPHSNRKLSGKQASDYSSLHRVTIMCEISVIVKRGKIA